MIIDNDQDLIEVSIKERTLQSLKETLAKKLYKKQKYKSSDDILKIIKPNKTVIKEDEHVRLLHSGTRLEIRLKENYNEASSTAAQNSVLVETQEKGDEEEKDKENKNK